MSTLLATIAAFGNIATRAQLVAEGFSGFALTAAVRGGELARIRRGWYRTAEANPDAVAAVRVGGRLSHSSAARSLGLWSSRDPRLHVCVTRGASRLRRPRFHETPVNLAVTSGHPGSEPRLVEPQVAQPSLAEPPLTEPSWAEPRDAGARAVVVHWLRPGRQDLRSAETWRVTLRECLRQVVATSDPETAVACLDTAISTFGLTQIQLQRIFRNEPERSRKLAAQARSGSDSGLESIVRQRLTVVRVNFRQQVFFPRIGRVDFVVDDTVVVEIDGWAFHKSAEAFEKDRRRDALLTERGLTVLRFSYRQVTEDWMFVERVIRGTSRRAARRA